MKNIRYDIAAALESLQPEAQWKMEGNLDYESIQWLSSDIQKPTRQEVLNECSRLKTLYENTEYQRLRVMVYPSIQDQLDMIYHDIKEGTLDSGSWISTIQSIKEEFPKP